MNQIGGSSLQFRTLIRSNRVPLKICERDWFSRYLLLTLSDGTQASVIYFLL